MLYLENSGGCMHNNKGMTIVELLLSVVLISLVLIFTLQLCLRVRNAYINTGINVKYELSKSIIIDAVMTDFIKKGTPTITKNTSNIIFTFPGDDEPVVKTLSISNGSTIIIKYSGGDDPTIAREYSKDDVTYGGILVSNISEGNNSLNEYIIKLTGKDGNIYNINLYCPI